MIVEFETRVRGGLPLIAKVKIYPPEPDVGIFHEQAEILELYWLSGKPISRAVWRRIPSADLDRIEEEAKSEAIEARNDYADYLYEQRRDAEMEKEFNSWTA
jgi:hypothetical protein